jgi:hypothetical protein
MNPEPVSTILPRVMKKFRLTAPKPFVPKEYDEQLALFDYAAVAAKQDWRWKLLFCTLNGVRVPIGVAKKMKRAGNRAGVPDVILPVVGYAACPGLFIEMKRIKGGVISNDQHWWHKQLRDMGYQVTVCAGAKAAIDTITKYLAAAKEGG